MAVINFVNRKNNLSGTMAHLKTVCNYCMKKEKAAFITCYNCTAETVFEQFKNTKYFYGKTTGRQFIHFTQNFSPKDNLTLEQAHMIALKLTEKYKKNYEVLITTHKDREHIHTHFIINSVLLDGKKYQQSQKELQELKDLSDRLCLEYGLSVIPQKNNIRYYSYKEYQAKKNDNSWKEKLEKTITHCLSISKNKYEFIKNFKACGYNIVWKTSRKNITYITPEKYRCRDKRLSSKFLKTNMEKFFLNRNLTNCIEKISNSLTMLEAHPKKEVDTRDLSKQAKKELYEIERNKSYIDWQED